MRFILFLSCFLSMQKLNAQQDVTGSFLDLNYFKGSIALHNNDILHLIQGHPEGIIMAWNKKTNGNNLWEQRFNYPDYGVSVIYQNLKNKVLGNPVSIYGHFNFYFVKRKIMFRIGQGLAYTNKPYNRLKNHKNIAFGSHIMSSTYLMLNYKQERLIDNLGFQLGLSLIHYSNANVKAPNTSINAITLNAGLRYEMASKNTEYKYTNTNTKLTWPTKYNFIFRCGINESDIIGSGQFPFYIFSAYADKQISQSSGLQVGTELFLSNFLKEYIRYRGSAFPEENNDGTADYKRIGVFVGHELFINKLAIITQLGYYIYYPYHFEGRGYIRVGLKRYFGKKWFGTVSLKSHGAKAEALEFGVGIRL